MIALFHNTYKLLYCISLNKKKKKKFCVQIYPSDPNSNAFPPSPSTPSGSPQALSGKSVTVVL